ncbi:MAG: YccF domain-containing protein [Acidobacteriota bacterium]|nr:YccF domain-containing protein [Acidobacteriota bacterium]
MFARFVYFVFIGWWLGLFISIAGLLLCSTIIGLPLGTMLLNRLPTFVYMLEPGDDCPMGYDHRHMHEEVPFILRVIWFFVIGWGLGSFLITFGYLATITIIGIPVGIWMLNRVPLAMTLSRHYD